LFRRDAPGIVRPVTTRSRSWRRRWFAAAAGTVAALLLGELVLRALGLPDTNKLFLSTEGFEPGVFVQDRDCFWRLAPGPDSNEQGLRGPWFEAAKAANEFRVLAVGDSCTYGFGVDWEDAYAVLLERILQGHRPRDVVRSGLAALPGYSTFQNHRLLTRVLPAARPDVVVFYCGAWNDYVPTAGSSDLDLAAQLDGSRVLLLLRSIARPGLAHYRAMFERGEAPNGRRVPVEDFERLLGEMVARCRAAGAQVVLIAPSHPASTLERHPLLGTYRDRVLAIGEREKVVVVDLAEVARRLDPDGAEPVPGYTTACFLDWVHPARNLHEALAQAIAERLGAPPRPSPDRAAAVPLLEVRDGAVRIASGGLSGPIHRAWLGDHRVAAKISGAEVVATVPPEIPPGRHSLQIVTADGVRDLGEVVLPPLPLRVVASETAVTFSGEGQAGRLVVLWTATALADVVKTAFGEFGLAIAAIRQPVAGVHRFDLAVADRYTTQVAADGTWSIAVPRTVARAADGAVHAQALVLDVGTRRGVLTAVVTAR